MTARLAPEAFWQRIDPAGTHDGTGPFEGAFPAILRDGSELLLPIRPLADRGQALASLIVNQASFAVEERLAADLADALRPFAPEIVVGVPTLGLSLARATARALGHARMVPLGTSRKFWYDEGLSVPLSSVTSPGQDKRLYLDPRLRPLLDGRRIALVDDVISTGRSIVAALDLLDRIGVRPVVLGAAMLQSRRWEERLSTRRSPPVVGAFRSPLLVASGPGRWRAESGGITG